MQYSSRYLLLLLFFSLYSLSFSISYLGRHGTYTYYTPTSQFYLDLGEFEKDDYIYFKVKVEYGYFSDYYMSYDGFYTYPSSGQTLKKKEYYYSYSSGSSYYDSYYYSYALYYSILKPSGKYLVIETPYAHLYSSGFAYISNEGGLSTGAIIGICAAVIVAIAIASVVTYFVRRARRASYISPPVAVYAPPVTPPPTYY
jgi:hypothetical protein